MPGGLLTLLQVGPLFPAETVTKMPAAVVFSTIVLSVSCAHSSLGGQLQLLFITCGRRFGLGF